MTIDRKFGSCCNGCDVSYREEHGVLDRGTPLMQRPSCRVRKKAQPHNSSSISVIVPHTPLHTSLLHLCYLALHVDSEDGNQLMRLGVGVAGVSGCRVLHIRKRDNSFQITSFNALGGGRLGLLQLGERLNHHGCPDAAVDIHLEV